ncbi:endonuclease/exonuclease/phosphatase family metal-dependent hydrolase [Spirosoma lacussanchae]|uniref:endonuclease/exonuclease/phosphatase family protein n=1 Tax=Spirosoma lacussanchae TaxID=1884249 RepID=UPI001109633B|nr:endonuclease/exonuclease/phosphatase family protein [Spirosoma lacussanchae]
MTVRTQVSRFIAFFFRSLLWSLNLLLVLYTALAYWLLQSMPTEHWLSGMIMISIPVAWVFNLLFVFFWLTSRPWRSWLSGLVLVIGMILFGPRTFVWNSPIEPTGSTVPFRVFSYNVQGFGYTDDQVNYPESSPKVRRMANYVLRYEAPIKCLQEFYNSVALKDYDLVSRFRQSGYVYSVLLHPELATARNGPIGAAIFSTYPIVSSGREPFSGFNGIVWANIKIGTDTICVINVHLKSMGIRVGKVLRQDELTGVKHETRGVLSALRSGFISRREQVRRVEEYIRNSRYPVVVTGDHNDTPYSVVYERMRQTLPNSFETSGRGFGFTYNRLPGFIRIDHQFYDPELHILNFETLNYVSYSDHYPIVGTYQLK